VADYNGASPDSSLEVNSAAACGIAVGAGAGRKGRRCVRSRYSARRGPHPSGRYASPSLALLRPSRHVSVPAFVALRLTLRRFSQRSGVERQDGAV